MSNLSDRYQKLSIMQIDSMLPDDTHHHVKETDDGYTWKVLFHVPGYDGSFAMQRPYIESLERYNPLIQVISTCWGCDAGADLTIRIAIRRDDIPDYFEATELQQYTVSVIDSEKTVDYYRVLDEGGDIRGKARLLTEVEAYLLKQHIEQYIESNAIDAKVLIETQHKPPEVVHYRGSMFETFNAFLVLGRSFWGTKPTNWQNP